MSNGLRSDLGCMLPKRLGVIRPIELDLGRKACHWMCFDAHTRDTELSSLDKRRSDSAKGVKQEGSSPKVSNLSN